MSIREDLFYTTTRIICEYNGQTSIGTAFFFTLGVDGKRYPLLVTNKHVVLGQRILNCIIEVHSDSTEKEIIKIESSNWFFHPCEDLAVMFVNGIFQQALYSKGKKLKSLFLTEDHLIHDQDMKVIEPIEEVLMVGYPRAIYDEVNNLPIIRRGVTASMIGKEYNGKRQGLLDIAVIYGSSGSPVFITKNYVSGQLTLKNDYIKLLGVNFSGEIFDNPVEEVTSNKNVVKEFINLARYVDARCLLDFKEIIRKFVNP